VADVTCGESDRPPKQKGGFDALGATIEWRRDCTTVDCRWCNAIAGRDRNIRCRAPDPLRNILWKLTAAGAKWCRCKWERGGQESWMTAIDFACQPMDLGTRDYQDGGNRNAVLAFDEFILNRPANCRFAKFGMMAGRLSGGSMNARSILLQSSNRSCFAGTLLNWRSLPTDLHARTQEDGSVALSSMTLSEMNRPYSDGEQTFPGGRRAFYSAMRYRIETCAGSWKEASARGGARRGLVTPRR